MTRNRCHTNVANLKAYFDIWNERREADDGIHGNHQNGLIKDLNKALTSELKWSHSANNDD